MFVAIAFATPKVQQLAILIIMGDVLRAIAIGNKNIAVGINRGFGRDKFFSLFLNACFQWNINGHQYTAIHGGFVNLVLYGIGYV